MTCCRLEFPIGAVSYSSGIEWGGGSGEHTPMRRRAGRLASLLADGPGICDGVFSGAEHRAASARRWRVEQVAANSPKPRRRLGNSHLETAAQGRGLPSQGARAAAWNCDGLESLMRLRPRAIAYPSRSAIVTRAMAFPLAPRWHGFFTRDESKLDFAGARLVPIGANRQQRVLSAREPVVVAVGRRALQAALDDAGGASFRAASPACCHETNIQDSFRRRET